VALHKHREKSEDVENEETINTIRTMIADALFNVKRRVVMLREGIILCAVYLLSFYLCGSYHFDG
jgi:hypothetical protein